MDMLGNVLELNDKASKLTVLFGSAVFVVLLIQNNKKMFTKETQYSLMMIVFLATLYIGYNINNEEMGLNNNINNVNVNNSNNVEIDDESDLESFENSSTISELSNAVSSYEEHFQDPDSGEAEAEAAAAAEAEAAEAEAAEAEAEAAAAEAEAAAAAAEAENANNSEPDEYNETGIEKDTSSVASSEPDGNEDYQSLSETDVTPKLPEACFPKDILNASELLPKDTDSAWAQNVPAGNGELKDQNFLNAGYHIGVNTVGQSLRNANRQLRSEPINPQVKVSPWLQSTIEPDVNRRPLEISA